MPTLLIIIIAVLVLNQIDTPFESNYPHGWRVFESGLIIILEGNFKTPGENDALEPHYKIIHNKTVSDIRHIGGLQKVLYPNKNV